MRPEGERPMFRLLEFTAEERQILQAALDQLCGPDAEQDERDEVRRVLIELADTGVKSVEDLVARATALLPE